MRLNDGVGGFIRQESGKSLLSLCGTHQGRPCEDRTREKAATKALTIQAGTPASDVPAPEL